MSAVVKAIANVIEDVFEAVGDVVEAVVNVAEKVIDTVAENPLLIVAAIAAPYALSALAAESAVIGVATAAETAIAGEALATSLSAFEVAGAAEAVSSGVAVLEATGTATAVASAETVAASTLIEAGAGVEAASAGASLVAEGASVAEAVTTASSGTVGTSSIVEAASGTWESMSQAAQNFTQSIGETLAPGADSSIQKIVGQAAQNTATNGGDFKKGIENAFLNFGTNILGGEVADITGSDMAGRAASNATRQLAKTGDIDLGSLASGEVGRFVGSEVADETGSGFAGKAAANVTNSALQGKDAKTGLLKLGINEGVNSGFDAASDLFGAPEAETVSDIRGDEGIDDAATPDSLDEIESPSRNLDSFEDESEIKLDESDDAQEPDFEDIAGTSGESEDTLDDLSDMTDLVDGGEDPNAEKEITAEEAPKDILAEIEQITSPEDNKIPQGSVSSSQLVAPKEEAPVGGLNVIQKTQEPQVDPVTGEVTSPTSGVPLTGSGVATSLLKGKVSGALNQAVAPPPAKKVVKKPVGGLNAVKAPAQKVDVSTLIPIAKAPVKKKVVPKTTTTQVATASPVSNISGLSSLLGTGG